MNRNQLINISHLRCNFCCLLAILRHYLAKTASCITTQDWLPLVSSKCKQRSERSVPRSFQMQLSYPISSRNSLRMSELSAISTPLRPEQDHKLASRITTVSFIPISSLHPQSCSRILAKLEKIQTTQHLHSHKDRFRYLRAIASTIEKIFSATKKPAVVSICAPWDTRSELHSIKQLAGKTSKLQQLLSVSDYARGQFA
jgi:hypothetical protein